MENTHNNVNNVVTKLFDNMEAIGINEIVKERDKHSTRSTEWKFLNYLKASLLERYKPSMNEPLKVVYDRHLESIFKNKTHIYAFSDYGRRVSRAIEQNTKILSRSSAEYDNRYRQLVANAIIKIDDRFYLLSRNKEFNDKRLCGYIGLVGGHINKDDKSLKDGLMREVEEELTLKYTGKTSVKPLGFIRLNTDDISKEHLCVLYVIEIKLDKDSDFKVFSNSRKETLTSFKEKDLIREVKKDKMSSLDSWAVKAFELYFKL